MKRYSKAEKNWTIGIFIFLILAMFAMSRYDTEPLKENPTQEQVQGAEIPFSTSLINDGELE